MSAVDTKKATRRNIRFEDCSSILADLDRLESAEKAGTLTRHGNWTLGQITHHLADLIEQSIDGFRFSAPAPIRMIFRLLRPMILGRPFPTGIKLKGQSATLLPAPDITSEQGLAALRTQIQRLEEGAEMNEPSPLFGRLTHAQWMDLHRRHAELHLGFLDPGEA